MTIFLFVCKRKITVTRKNANHSVLNPPLPETERSCMKYWEGHRRSKQQPERHVTPDPTTENGGGPNTQVASIKTDHILGHKRSLNKFQKSTSYGLHSLTTLQLNWKPF